MSKGNFSKLVVAFCILFIVFYVVVSMYMFYRTGAEMGIMTPLVFAFFGTELCMLLIKTIYTKKTTNTVESKPITTTKTITQTTQTQIETPIVDGDIQE